MKRLARFVVAAAAVAASFLAPSVPARAADPAPPAGGPPAEVVYARVTLAGIDRADTAMVKAGFAGAGDLLAEKLTFFPFIPPDGMNRQAPLSVFFVGGDAVAKQAAAGFMLPLRPGVAPLDEFKKNGNFQPVPGHDDTIVLQGTPFRRTAGYLMFGGTQATIVQPHEDALAAVVRDPDVLLRADVDIALIRKAAPKAYREFFDQMQKQQAAEPAKGPGEKAGQEWVNKYLRDGLDHLSYVIRADGADAAMDVTMGPVKVTPGPATWAKPAFPAGVIGRLDYAHPAKEAAPAAVEGLTALMRLGGNGSIPDGVAEADVRELFDALADLVLGDAVSVGVRPADKSFVAYVVVQREQAKDLNRQLDRIVAAGEKVEKQAAATRPAGAKPEASFDRSTYRDDAGATVTRLAVTGKDGTTMYFDLLPQGNRLLATVGTTGDRHVSALTGVKFEGKIADLVEAEVDLPALAKVLESMPNGPAGEQAKLLRDALKDGKAKFAVTVDGKALTLKYRVPLKSIGSMLNAAAGR